MMFLITFIALAACGGAEKPGTQPAPSTSSPSPSDSSPSPSPTGTATPPVGGATAAEIIDNEYRPAEITVSIGSQVLWTHRGTASHSVTADGGAFDSSPDCPTDLSKCMMPGATFPFTFTTAGRFAYHCKVHGTLMAGTVVVQ